MLTAGFLRRFGGAMYQTHGPVLDVLRIHGLSTEVELVSGGAPAAPAAVPAVPGQLDQFLTQLRRFSRGPC